ncbi:PQQ-dependent sugar dehydrogenase [Shigella sonnei]
MPKLSTGNHFGGQYVFDGKGHLFIALGENNLRTNSAESDKLQGKLVHLTDLEKSRMIILLKGIRCARRDRYYGIRNPKDGDESVE